MIAEIRAVRPNFILNNLIGPSQYAFVAAMRDLAREDATFAPGTCPILSCNLTECELPALGEAAEGLVAAGPYFRGAGGWPGPGNFGSSHEAAAHGAVRVLAGLLAGREGSEGLSLSELLADPSAQGCGIDGQTHHTVLPVLIAEVQGGRFAVIERQAEVAGDPYLTRPRMAPLPRLRAVT
jgi:branched-chain amino acid transport system substrate-binding protein